MQATNASKLSIIETKNNLFSRLKRVHHIRDNTHQDFSTSLFTSYAFKKKPY